MPPEVPVVPEVKHPDTRERGYDFKINRTLGHDRAK